MWPQLAEIEIAAASAAGVVEAAALPSYKDGRVTRLDLFVTPEGVDPATVLARCRELLPSAAVPEAVHARAVMPRTPNGKIDRQRLATGLSGSC